MTDKYCRDCIHYRRESCFKTGITVRDSVTGELLGEDPYARREIGGKCGPGAVEFEMKRSVLVRLMRARMI